MNMKNLFAAAMIATFAMSSVSFANDAKSKETAETTHHEDGTTTTEVSKTSKDAAGNKMKMKSKILLVMYLG